LIEQSKAQRYEKPAAARLRYARETGERVVTAGVIPSFEAGNRFKGTYHQLLWTVS